MIRPFTIITMLLAAGSGAYLFAVKHHAQMLDDQIASISQASRLDGERIRVLQAQWALEIDPTRLQSLATQFTGLQPMQPAQLITLAALRSNLPAAGSAAPASNPELPGQVMPELDASNAQPGQEVAGALPMPPPQAPARSTPARSMPMLASAAPVAKPYVLKPFARSAHHTSHSALADNQLADAAAPRAYAPPRVFASPVEPVQRSLPMGAQVMSVKASATVPQYRPPAPDDSGSALGMAANLPPPQPLPQGGMNN